MAELRNSLSGGDSLVGILSAVDTLSGEISPQATMSATMSVPEIVQTEPFLGEYTYEPSNETQTIEIEGKRALSNITINPSPPATLQTKSVTYTPTESKQEETITPDIGYDGLGEVGITVKAINSSYIGSGVPRKNENDVTISRGKVVFPYGFYHSIDPQAPIVVKALPQGVIDSPVATKGAVDNHSISVTPLTSVSTEGWLNTGESTGDAVTVTATELVSGNKSISENGVNIDVANYETVSVNVTPTLQDKTVSYTPTESQQTATATADSGYDGLNEVSITVGAIDSEYVGSDVPRKSSSDLTASGATVIVPSGYYGSGASKTVQMGTAGTPTASKGAVSNHSVSVTPSVTNQAGYIYSETKTGTAVSVSASELVSGTKSITQNGTEDVTNYASVSVSVPNSYSASDEGKVVDNGALASQTSATYTANDTYDTTLINEVTVNVSGGGGGVDDPTDFTGGNILAIKGHGTEYIITDVYPNFVGVYGTKLADNTVDNYEYYWGALGTNTAYLCLQRNGTGNTITVKGMGSVNVSYTGFSSGNIVTPVFSSIGMAEPATKNKPLAIGRGYYNGKIETSIAIYTFYGLNILNSNFEYTYRFVPWLDNGVACIKELISGTIYHNSGTGAYDYIDLEGVFHNA